MLDRVHTTLLQHFIGGWIHPMVICPPAGYVFLHHPIHHTDVESLKSGHYGRAQDPCLDSVQEDRLHDGIEKLGTHPWGCTLLSQHLFDPCPCPVCLAKLTPHDLDVDWLSSQLEQFVMFGNLFQYKPTTRRLIPNFYGNLRLAGAQTIWLLHFMLGATSGRRRGSMIPSFLGGITVEWRLKTKTKLLSLLIIFFSARLFYLVKP
jgi:hypothetical protein